MYILVIENEIVIKNQVPESYSSSNRLLRIGQYQFIFSSIFSFIWNTAVHCTNNIHCATRKSTSNTDDVMPINMFYTWHTATNQLVSPPRCIHANAKKYVYRGCNNWYRSTSVSTESILICIIKWGFFSFEQQSSIDWVTNIRWQTRGK